MRSRTYKHAGVDIRRAEAFVKKVKAKTQGLAAFGSAFSLIPFLKQYKHPLLVSSTDGVGTKLKIAQSLGMHQHVGIDLVAMNVNDIVCLGAKPLFFLDYIACGKLNIQTLIAVVGGVESALRDSDCVLIGGETAEMPGMYKKDEYDLAGFCVGIVDKNKVINGKNIKANDAVIGIASSGLHSNGFSLVRHVLSNTAIKKMSRQILTPTRLYVKPIMKLLSSFDAKKRLSAIKGIAHITGGAFYNKAVKVLPKELGMVIDTKSWPLPKIFTYIQKKGAISDKEMYSVFNMGIGMMVVVGRTDAERAMNILNRFYPAYKIGRIVRSAKRMTLV